MQSFQGVQRFSVFVRNRLQSLFGSPDICDAASYEVWRHRFMYQRLSLGVGLALISYLTFTLSQLNNLLFNPENFQLTWLLTQMTVELGLLGGFLLLRTAIGVRYPAFIFLLLTWLITLSPQIRSTLEGFSRPAIIEWPLTFFSLATLIPVCWPLHLIAQAGTFIYYLATQILLNLKVEFPTPWMTSDFLFLYFFWICFISNLSVYLYDRLARAEFNSRRALQEAYQELTIEQERSEDLLLNILPVPIAQRLKQIKQKPATIADHFTNAGVLFGDIVGFTELSGKIPPAELVQLLGQIFTRFDHLADKHNLEKIKTIGDAYMVVSGLPVPQEDYAQAIADMALDMQETLQEFNRETGQKFKMRIGIAIGPVVAGVIGLKKFIYDLWGDTVNIASRMESHGIANEIQVTEATYNALKNDYAFERRGAIFVKGKGEMITYLLKGKKHSIPLPAQSVTVE
ncbi:MAG: adenylate/guanylate cyclase domain-containing protein [Lyngbya sp.]|nr:adenylate/guanylate cyclase domain-containing protein [Lyngbya sp.]